MTASEISEGDWRLLNHDPVTGVTRWFLDIGDHYVIRTDTPVDQLLDDNAEAYNNSLSKRWGDGQIVASIPLNVYYQELAPARRQGDHAYVRRWLNDSDHSKFRTFKGTV